MRAVQYDRYGPPEVLHETEVPVPVITPEKVLVRVHALSINGGELPGRAGRLRLVTGRTFPRGTGIDFVGEVAEVGSAASGVRPGQRVWGVLPHQFRSAAEYLSVHPRQLAAAPRDLSPVEAASILVGATTSIIALRDKTRLAPGERLLVRGASGGVGSVAVQLGKARGAHVTALASKDTLDFVRGLGADEVHDHRTTSPADLGTFDVIMDTVGDQHRAYRPLLSRRGRMVAIAFDINHVPTSLAYILGSVVRGRRRVRLFSGRPQHDLLTEVTRYVDDGDIRPVVDTVHPLADLAGAHRALEAGGVRGKHVIQVL